MPLNILIILYFILFAILSWRHLDWSIYVIIIGLPTYLIRFQIFSIPFTILEGMILILFIVWLIKEKDIRNIIAIAKKLRKDLVIPIGLFLLAATISIFTVPDIQAAAGIWKAYFIEPILFFIVFINSIKTDSHVKNILWALGLSLFIPGLLAIYQKFTGAFITNPFWAAESTRRVTSVYGFPNAIGLYFAPVVTMLIGLFVGKIKNFHNNKQQLIIFGLLIIIGTLSILFAVSKGAVLAIGIGMLFYAIFWQGYRKYFISLLVLLSLLGFIVVPQLFSLSGTNTVAGGGSLEVRTQQWQEAIEMLKTKPILGAGLSGYQSAVAPFHQKKYIEIFMYPHNIILNFWSEIGLLGLLAFIWLVVIFFRKIGDLKDLNYRLQITDYRLLIAGAMVTLLSHGLVDVPYFKNDLSVLFWILFGLVVVISRKYVNLNNCQNSL